MFCFVFGTVLYSQFSKLILEIPGTYLSHISQLMCVCKKDRKYREKLTIADGTCEIADKINGSGSLRVSDIAELKECRGDPFPCTEEPELTRD